MRTLDLSTSPEVRLVNKLGSVSIWSQLAAIVAFAGVWQILWISGILAQDSFPSVPQIAGASVDALSGSALWVATLQTIQGWAIGLVIASTGAIALATIMSRSDFLYDAIMPIVEFVKVVPAIALLPLIIAILGPTMKMKVALVTWGIFWAFTIQVVYGLRSTDPVQSQSARVMGLRGLPRFFSLTLPSVSPYLATGFRIGAAVGLIEAIVAELIGGAPGLGLHILNALNTGPSGLPRMYAYILATGVTGMLLTGTFSMIERRVLHWHESQRVANRRVV